MTITTHELLSSYYRTLLAKCQIAEFQSWGGTVVETCRRQIAAHQELEDRYVAQMMVNRAEEAERFKRALGADDCCGLWVRRFDRPATEAPFVMIGGQT